MKRPNQRAIMVYNEDAELLTLLTDKYRLASRPDTLRKILKRYK